MPPYPDDAEVTLNGLAGEIWQTCEEKGFHEPVDPEFILKGLQLMLVVSECAEALDAMRKGESEHEEIADAIIRLLHYGASHGIDLDNEVFAKMTKNKNRPYLHGKRF